MVSQNRAAEEDRVAAHDVAVDQRSEARIDEILAVLHADAQRLDDIARHLGPAGGEAGGPGRDPR
jgi:uncharacterized membrane protein